MGHLGVTNEGNVLGLASKVGGVGHWSNLETLPHFQVQWLLTSLLPFCLSAASLIFPKQPVMCTLT